MKEFEISTVLAILGCVVCLLACITGIPAVLLAAGAIWEKVVGVVFLVVTSGVLTAVLVTVIREN